MVDVWMGFELVPVARRDVYTNQGRMGVRSVLCLAFIWQYFHVTHCYNAAQTSSFVRCGDTCLIRSLCVSGRWVKVTLVECRRNSGNF